MQESEEMKRKSDPRRPTAQMQIEQMISQVRDQYFSPVLFEERNESVSVGRLSGQNMKAPLQRSRSRQNINFSSTRVPTAKEPHYESEAHSSAAHRATHRPNKEREKEKAREREKEKEQTPQLCSSNCDSDVEALLARLRAL
ncbi:hypothetical protein IRJ41_007460 [Triplophysa rosa]|uniref:Uncharacterized protein n=1 Tax=Triplophysa rosa TaxID=992332 RepID=A0A9W7WDJ6_TRIRA|nr:hypothetical protein IRJ41_007460 [Triplophysa rosa]